FGHTFGHAIEKVSGLSHGEAVSAGMVMASALSVKRGLLSAQEDRRLHDLLKRLKLQSSFASGPQKIFDAVAKDKKRAGDRIHFVLLNGIGKAVVEPITLKKLKETLYA
ncbi:MAG: 3-dehydroquinate synthase, partial [Desulfobacterales bacterium]